MMIIKMIVIIEANKKIHFIDTLIMMIIKMIVIIEVGNNDNNFKVLWMLIVISVADRADYK